MDQAACYSNMTTLETGMFGLGFLPIKKPDWEEGAKMALPPELVTSNQMTMKLGLDILWVKIFTN